MRDKKLLGHIACRPSTAQYIRWREFLNKEDHLQIPGKTPFASFLTSQFSFCVFFHTEGFFPPPPAPQLTGYTERLTFECSGPLATEHIFQLMDFTAAKLDEFCHDLMYDDLMRMIICGKYEKAHEKTIVEDFLRERGLEDHIQWDAAIKSVYRLRQGRNLPSFRGYSKFTMTAAPACPFVPQGA